ncbi:PREDICTED: uncharacterized protein LOC106124655 isoform X2 [Papilio xuthus]|nr:PREDICTED: uncharacterized protein LOC106124655 isoform X2 [Papilio xuthus]
MARSSAASAASSGWRRGPINIIVVEDLLGHVLEIIFWRCKMIPALLLKIISLCIPFHPNLNKISVRWGPSRGFALKEIVKFLPASYLTEICLDDSPIPRHDVHTLLEESTSLRCLSLARCILDDEACALLAGRLHYPMPAATSLQALTLSSNLISEAGAAALAAALRSNRALRHLDLADNALSAAGVAHIFRTLGEFPLSDDEHMGRNRRRFEYLKLRNEIFPPHHKEPSKTLSKIERRSTMLSIRRSTRKLSPDADKENVVPIRSRQKLGSRLMSKVASKALLGPVPSWQSLSAEETLSSLTVPSSVPGAQSAPSVPDAAGTARLASLLQLKRDPFSKYKTFVRNGIVFSFGNMKLASLNLAYNRLDRSSVGLLCRVLAQQAAWRDVHAPAHGLAHAHDQSHPNTHEQSHAHVQGHALAHEQTLTHVHGQAHDVGGLLHVQLDGNPVAEDSAELRELQTLLERALSVREERPARRKPAHKHYPHKH